MRISDWSSDVCSSDLQMKRLHRLVVGYPDVAGTAAVLQEGVLGANAGVIQPGRYRMGFGDLAIVIGEHIGAIAVQHTGATGHQRRGVAPGLDTFAGRFRAPAGRAEDRRVGKECVSTCRSRCAPVTSKN